MSKLKRETVYVTGSGPVRVAIDAWDGALALFSRSARNSIVRDSLWQGGEYYRVTFVPLKFTNYAKKFGYHITAQWEARKRRRSGAAVPLVWDGDLKTSVLGSSRTKAVATEMRAYIDIIMPGPRYMTTPTIAGVLRSALPAEIERVATVVAKAIAEQMEGVSSQRGGAAPLRRLSAGQSATFARSTSHRSRPAPGKAPRKAS